MNDYALKPEHMNRLPDTQCDVKDRYLLLDRDGTINRNRAGGVTRVRQFELLPGAANSLGRLTLAGWQIIVITNQSNMGRGKLSHGDLLAIHQKMTREVDKYGGKIVDIYFCPHAQQDGCRCRKPAPLMLEQAAKDYGFNLADTFFVGDQATDCAAARAAGAKPVLVRSGPAAYHIADCPVFNDLESVATALLRGRLTA